MRYTSEIQKQAHAVLRRARRAGLIKRQPCEVCDSPNSHAHHPDYSKPLDIVWLCAPHHQQMHWHGAICGEWHHWSAEFAMSPHLPIAVPYWEPGWAETHDGRGLTYLYSWSPAR